MYVLMVNYILQIYIPCNGILLGKKISDYYLCFYILYFIFLIYFVGFYIPSHLYFVYSAEYIVNAMTANWRICF